MLTIRAHSNRNHNMRKERRKEEKKLQVPGAYTGLYRQGEVEASSRCCLATGVDLPPRGRGKRVDVGM
jgi:hypothetical protein